MKSIKIQLKKTGPIELEENLSIERSVEIVQKNDVWSTLHLIQEDNKNDVGGGSVYELKFLWEKARQK